MVIRRASKEDKNMVLKALDDFNDFANSMDDNWDGKQSTFSRENSGAIFDELVESEKSVLLIAVENDDVVGFLELHKVP